MLVRPDLSCARHRFDLYKLFLLNNADYSHEARLKLAEAARWVGSFDDHVDDGSRASRRRAPSSPCLRCVTRCTLHPPIRPVSSPGPDPEWFTLVRDVSRLDRGLDCAVSLVSVTRLSVSRPLPVESQTLSIGLSWALSHSLRRAQPSSLWSLHSTRHSAPRVAESLHSHVTRLDHVILRA